MLHDSKASFEDKTPFIRIKNAVFLIKVLKKVKSGLI